MIEDNITDNALSINQINEIQIGINIILKNIPYMVSISSAISNCISNASKAQGGGITSYIEDINDSMISLIYCISTIYINLFSVSDTNIYSKESVSVLCVNFYNQFDSILKINAKIKSLLVNINESKTPTTSTDQINKEIIDIFMSEKYIQANVNIKESLILISIALPRMQ
jgi:hypothetical protein